MKVFHTKKKSNARKQIEIFLSHTHEAEKFLGNPWVYCVSKELCVIFDKKNVNYDETSLG